MRVGRFWSRASAWLSVVGGLCLGVAGCGDSPNAERDFGGTVAFEREGDVYLIAASGDNERKLEGASAPFSWSPDGARLAYTSEGIGVINSETGATEWQSREPCYRPVWSPRGDLITCETEEPYHVVTVNTRTRASSKLTPDCCYLPAWSPDGQQLAYWSFGNDYVRGGDVGPSGLFVMSADGSGKRHLTRRGSVGSYINAPAWSPDGDTIAFIDGHDIWTIDAGGGKPRRLFNGAGGTTNDLAWHPDGRRLAFTHGDGHDFELYVIDADGTGLRNLTDNDETDRQPSWSPDGKALTFSTNRDGNFEIYVMNADGSSPRRLTNTRDAEASPAWSPSALQPPAAANDR